jgi:hypothetical protein
VIFRENSVENKKRQGQESNNKNGIINNSLQRNDRISTMEMI